MAHKPAAKLPDVFARPGAAPARGTAIEDLPKEPARATAAAEAGAPQAPAPPKPQAPPVVTEAPAAAEPAKVAQPAKPAEAAKLTEPASPPAAAAASPPPPPPPPPPPVAASVAPLRPETVQASRTAPPPAYTPPPEEPEAPAGRGSAWTMAMVAIGLTLTAPLWQDSVLGLFGYTSSVSLAQKEDAITLARQERKLSDLEQRIGSASSQLGKAQTELAQTTRRSEEAAVWVRAMTLSRLAEDLRRAAPFAANLGLVRGMASGGDDLNPLLDRIAAYAPIGVPTDAELDQDFRRLADHVLRQGRSLNPLTWMAGLMAMTPFGKPTPDTDPARVAVRAALVSVDGGNLNAAIEQVRQIPAPMADWFAGWTQDVRARQAADTIIRRADEVLSRTLKQATR